MVLNGQYNKEHQLKIGAAIFLKSGVFKEAMCTCSLTFNEQTGIDHIAQCWSLDC